MEELVMSPDLQRSVRAASEKGASAWLTALPIEEHGFALHKGAFRDALALTYGWPLKFCAEKMSMRSEVRARSSDDLQTRWICITAPQ